MVRKSTDKVIGHLDYDSSYIYFPQQDKIMRLPRRGLIKTSNIKDPRLRKLAKQQNAKLKEVKWKIPSAVFVAEHIYVVNNKGEIIDKGKRRRKFEKGNKMAMKKGSRTQIPHGKAKKIHENRSSLAQRIDESKMACKVLERPERRWVENPDRFDVKGIDDRRKIARGWRNVKPKGIEKLRWKSSTGELIVAKNRMDYDDKTRTFIGYKNRYAVEIYDEKGKRLKFEPAKNLTVARNIANSYMMEHEK
jgi:hypothetical protein